MTCTLVPASCDSVICTGPITYKGDAQLKRDLANLKRAANHPSVAEVFVPCASPASIEGWQLNSYYKTAEEYLHAIADAMRHEYQAVVAAGFLVQLDDPWLAMRYMSDPDSSVADVLKWGRIRVDALNYACAIFRRTASATTRVTASTSGRARRSRTQAFRRSRAQRPRGCVLVEARTAPRARVAAVGEREAARRKLIIPGVVTHTSVLVEHPRLWRSASCASQRRRRSGSSPAPTAASPRTPAACLRSTRRSSGKFALTEGARLASEQLWKVVGHSALAGTFAAVLRLRSATRTALSMDKWGERRARLWCR